MYLDDNNLTHTGQKRSAKMKTEGRGEQSGGGGESTETQDKTSERQVIYRIHGEKRTRVPVD